MFLQKIKKLLGNKQKSEIETKVQATEIEISEDIVNRANKIYSLDYKPRIQTTKNAIGVKYIAYVNFKDYVGEDDVACLDAEGNVVHIGETRLEEYMFDDKEDAYDALRCHYKNAVPAIIRKLLSSKEVITIEDFEPETQMKGTWKNKKFTEEIYFADDYSVN